MFRGASASGIGRRGFLAGAVTTAALLPRAGRAGAAAPLLLYEQRLRSRLSDCGGGVFDPAFASALLTQNNRLRGQQGLSGYQWDDGLAACARAHAADMAARRYFAHESPEAFTHLHRVSLLARDLCGETAENLAWRETTQDASTPQQFETLWEESPAHRRNLLRPDYASAGYGVVRVGGKVIAVGVYGQAALKLAAALPLVLPSQSEPSAALEGARPVVDRLAVTTPFGPPAPLSPVHKQLSLQAGAWQLRPARALGPGRYELLTGPIFFVG
jgi:uncharacterized protein YkwD